MRIYVASSWRNERQPEVVATLRDAGHEVYDFREPTPGGRGFNWNEVAPEGFQKFGQAAQECPPEVYLEAMRHPVAREGFRLDMNALRWCDACILVLPCGRSAHLELGWAAGAGKITGVLLDDPVTPELMYGMVGYLYTDLSDVTAALEVAA